MSLTAQIGSSESSFKLSQKIVSLLAEKFSFKFEDGWTTVSTRTLENIQKRLKREKRRSNPASSIKHPRTAFSFFTQKQRPVSQAAHPEATFGQLSRFVSEAWKLLTPEQMSTFKALEVADKERYQTERAAVLSAVASEAQGVLQEVAPAAEPVKEKKVRKAKTDVAATPAVEAATPAVEAATPASAKKVKTPKVAAAKPAEVVAAAPVAAAPAAKKTKEAKAPAAAAAATEAAPAAPAVVAEAKPAKVASAKAKAVKA